MLTISIQPLKGQAFSCGNMFEWNHDESNRIKSGSIQFLLEDKFDFEDLECEVVFAFKEFPIYVSKLFAFNFFIFVKTRNFYSKRITMYRKST